jgi:hypothetical protein
MSAQSQLLTHMLYKERDPLLHTIRTTTSTDSWCRPTLAPMRVQFWCHRPDRARRQLPHHLRWTWIRVGIEHDGRLLLLRVEAGCGSSYRHCAIYSAGVYRGEQNIYDTTSTCNAWSRTWGDFQECYSSAHVSDSGVFSEHTHTAPNWCG